MTILAAAIAVLVMGGMAKGATYLVRHDHAHGHCGWSGCQAPEGNTP